MREKHFAASFPMLAAFFVVAAAPAFGNRRPAATQPPSNFHASSDLVLINASVLDLAGHPVGGLEASEFNVLEGGVEQKIVSFNQGDMPVSVVLVLDTSRSMRKLIDRTAEAVSSLLNTSNPEDDYAVVEFADRPSLALDWTRDASQVRDSILRAGTRGNTALLDAVRFAGAVARRAANARRIMIVISDGMDNHSRRSVAGVKKYLLEANVQVYAINLMNDDGLWTTPVDADGPELLETICAAGGGRRLEVEKYTNLPKAIEQVAREIRNQYILGYQPSAHDSPGKYHSVELKLFHPIGAGRLSISWRHGYYEPLE